MVRDSWRQKSAFKPTAFPQAFENEPLAAIIITDIDADIGDAEDSLVLFTALASEARTEVFARGLSRSLYDLSRLKYVPSVSGAITWLALFVGSIDFEAALGLTKPQPETCAHII